jgi:hypothetical protein
VKSQILISDEPHSGSNPISYALKRRKPAIKAGFLNVVSEETFFEYQANPPRFDSLNHEYKKGSVYLQSLLLNVIGEEPDSNFRRTPLGL